jgi:hypothetical protein
MRLNQRGVALAEALVAAVLTAALVGTALGSLSLLQRALARQVSRTSRSQALRAALQLSGSELRDLAPGAGDLIAISSTGLVYRAVRATGLVCGRDGVGLQVSTGSFRSLRTPVPVRDSLAVMNPSGDWIRVGLDGSPRAGTCPAGGPAVTLPVATSVPDPLGAVSWPTPLRVTELMELRAYQSGAEWWLGQRSVSSGETIQPALGPLAPSGLVVSGFDSLGNPASVPADVRRLKLVVRLAAGDSAVRTLLLPPGGVR